MCRHSRDRSEKKRRKKQVVAELDNLKGRVARACRVLGTLDLTKAATGHVSARVPGTERVLIRARGHAELGVRCTTDDQVIEVDLDGKLVRSQDEDLACRSRSSSILRSIAPAPR
jgi:ribulose-5-phosphate 4-epimerase/fuculose-1-phosphate aldolase